MKSLRTRLKPPFTRRGPSFAGPAKRFWRGFHSSSSASKTLKTQAQDSRRFLSILCGGNELLPENLANGTAKVVIEVGTTHDKVIELTAAASTPSMEIDFLSPKLALRPCVSAYVFNGHISELIDHIATDYAEMHWWISDQGLVMADVYPETLLVLSGFNQIAGKLTIQKMAGGKLSDSDLAGIARRLDEAGYPLKENLQPGHWRLIATHNQKFSKRAIKTFEIASEHKKFGYHVRRRLYAARDAYREAFLEPH